MKKLCNNSTVKCYFPSLLFILLFCAGCKKEWLDAKPDSRLSVLTTLDDYTKLMDNSSMYVVDLFNQFGTDEYYMSEDNLKFMNAQNIPYYQWAPEGLATPYDPYWQGTYLNVFTCNTVLAGLEKIEKTAENQKLWDRLYGSALFYRALQYFQLAQSFIKPYNASTASTDPGIPLRTTANVSERVGRSSAKQVYDLVISDLLKARDVLPASFEGYKIRPSKHAVYGYLSRLYLSIEDYPKAKQFADSALAIKKELLDYNTVVPGSALGFNSHSFIQNPEVFFVCLNGVTGSILDLTYARVDSNLYKSYTADDLRKSLFFRLREVNRYSFMGTYQGAGQSSASLFMAPATDEMYLNRAECLAREGKFSEAMIDLNALLITRWKKNTFVPYVANNAEEALALVLSERKKQLLFRATRWSDLRRLNKDPKFATTIKRIYKGKEYLLTSGSNLYTWPLPNDEIQLGGLEQNPR